MQQKREISKEHLVSIVIPTYNRAKLISRALGSVLSQCITGDEVIVVDDGSTDNTEAVLEPYRDRIILLRASHGGAGRARNLGLSLANNNLIAFLDSDDEWMPGKLSIQRHLLKQRPDVLFCFSNFGYRYASGEEQHNILSLLSGKPVLGGHTQCTGFPFSSLAPLPEGWKDFKVYIGDLYPIQMEHEYVQVNTLVFRRTYDKEGGVRFPEDLTTREDWEFVGRLARNGLAAFMDCEMSYVHWHDGPQITKLSQIHYFNARIKTFERVWGVDQEYLEKNFEKYHATLNKEYGYRLKELLVLGKTAEARKDIRKVANLPQKYRTLAYLPGSLVRLIFKLRALLPTNSI